MATTESLPPGIYRIQVAGLDLGPSFLTRHGENGVTILPLSAQSGFDQEWQIIPARDGNVIIQRPKLIPPTFLSYRGAPKKPEPGDRVEDHFTINSPPTEWHVGIAPGSRSTLRVAGSDLGIAIAPPHIHPPILNLSHGNQLIWHFERRVPHVDE